jgi:hypothetical protein
MVVSTKSSSTNRFSSVAERDLPNWYKLRQGVGLGINDRISLPEAKEADIFDWQLPLDLQPSRL